MTSSVSLPRAATKSRCRFRSTPKWSMRPFTEGKPMVAAGSSTSAAWSPAGKTSDRNGTKISLRFAFIVAPFSAECTSQSQAQLPDGLVSVVSPANSDIERKTVPDAPDRTDEPRGGPRAAGGLLAEHLGDRAHRPGIRAFEDGAQEKIGLVLARPRERRIEMHRYPFGALGYDAGDGKTRPPLPIYGRKQQAIFCCDARTGSVLQRALPQHLFDEDPVVDQRAAPHTRLAIERHLALPLNHQFAIPLQAEVADHGRGDLYPFRALAPPAERPQLQLEFALLRNVGVRRVVRAKGKCGLRQRQEAQHE